MDYAKTIDQVAVTIERGGSPLSDAQRMLLAGALAVHLDAANNNWLSLEKQYAERLGRLAQLCDVVCPWVLDRVNPPDVTEAAKEIMDYVDAVRP